MGQFRVTVTAVGGHGCQREIKEGGTLREFCGSVSCPDCAAREFVRVLKRQGQNVESAVLEHWPGTESQVTDNLLTHVRDTGAFTQ